ncbi:MAG: hypothetical protein Q8R37_05695, partial [Nanoarchaeota archaeon]|nr:hypothetical protein [Nanoarchaeota archaeon]
KTEKLEKLVAAVKIEEKKPLITIVKTKTADTFFPSVDALFKTLEITVEKKDLVRKNAEVNFAVDIPSVVGKMRYFCKAKNKLKCDEKDLSSAYVEAQMKKLPLLFLYSNKLTKKAQIMINSGVFENLIIKKIE